MVYKRKDSTYHGFGKSRLSSLRAISKAPGVHVVFRAPLPHTRDSSSKLSFRSHRCIRWTTAPKNSLRILLMIEILHDPIHTILPYSREFFPGIPLLVLVRTHGILEDPPQHAITNYHVNACLRYLYLDTTATFGMLHHDIVHVQATPPRHRGRC